MWNPLVLFLWGFLLLSSVLGGSNDSNWKTLYSLSRGKVYVHLKNNELTRFNFSITGFEDLEKWSSYLSKELELYDNQQIKLLQSPPKGSNLFIVQDDLFGLYPADKSSDEKDTCGNGVMKVVQYDSDNDKWEDIKQDLDLSDVNDGSFYESSTILTSPSSKEIYIYGGKCSRTNEITDRLVSLDIETWKLSNISTSTKPQPFYGATNLNAPTFQQQLVIGGQSNSGWLSMYQLAIWDFSDGWSSQLIPKSNVNVMSRINALALPIFGVLGNSSKSYIMNHLNASETLIIGGDLLRDTSSNGILKLNHGSGSWEWENYDAHNFNADDILGAATIFNTLIIVNSSDSNTCKVNLLNTDNLKSVESLQKNVNSNDGKSSKKSQSIKNKAILGTVLPVSAIIFCILGGVILLRKRRKTKSDDFDDNFQIGNFYDQSLEKQEKGRNSQGTRPNDSNSTLEIASIDSWVRKRQEFEDHRTKGLRKSYLQSNETLSGSDDHDTVPQEITSPVTDISRSKSRIGTPITSPKGFSSLKQNIEEDEIWNKESQSDLQAKNSSYFDRTLSEKGHDSVPMLHQDLYKNHIHKNSDLSLDDEVDVQVLVSSKRRSILRVANPDAHAATDLEDGASEVDRENRQDDPQLRQRVPSK